MFGSLIPPEFAAALRPENVKKAAVVLMLILILVTAADRVIFPLFPNVAEPVLEVYEDNVPEEACEWLRAHRDAIEFGPVGALVVVAMGYAAFRRYAASMQAKQNEALAEDAVCLLVRTLPDDKAPIAAASNMFLAMRQAMASGPAWRGQAVHASLEIALFRGEGKVGFVLWTPAALKDALITQVQAHYPECYVEMVDDPAQVDDETEVAWAELGLAGDSIYPIRADFGRGDPLLSFIRVLAPDASSVAAGVQFIFRPANPKWQAQGDEYVAKSREQMSMTPARLLSKADKARVEAIEAKKDMAGYEVVVRVYGAGPDQGRVQGLIQAFGQFAGPLNSFVVRRQGDDAGTVRTRPFPVKGKAPVLNADEFAAVWHMPSIRTPSNDAWWRGAQYLPPPMGAVVSDEEYEAGRCRVLGTYDYPDGTTVKVGWRRGADSAPASYDALTHGYILGPTGSGKSTLISNLVADDIEHGCGVALLEPHDDLTDELLDLVPDERLGDVVVLDPTDEERPFGFNFMECPDPAGRAVLASSIMGVFHKVAGANWAGAVRMQEILRSSLLALLEVERKATMYHLYRFMVSEDYRAGVISQLTDEMTLSYWQETFDAMGDRDKATALETPLRRLRVFLTSPLVRNIVSQPESTVVFRQLMDTRRIVFMPLSATTLGEENAQLLGALFIGMMWQAASARRDTPEAGRVPFYVWADEFHNFVTDEIATILAEARKYGLGFVFANQFFAQVAAESPTVAAAIKGNCGTKWVYRLDSPDDISLMYAMVGQPVTKRDLNTLDPFTGYVRLMSGKRMTEPFTCKAPPPRAGSKKAGGVVLKDANARPFPPRPAVPGSVLALIKEMEGIPHRERVERIAALGEQEFAVYRQLRIALDWQERNRVLKEGSGPQSKRLRRASALAIGTPVYEVEAIRRRLARAEEAMVQAEQAVQGMAGGDAWDSW